ncbi:hypothetical protein A3G69_02555 [Candidatus Peribacteria bacterium RIFCSPLOWO2_12_FULL_53_10]|nr:MAG: hypothetical protein A3G69_02555 [Candidatus Peribacteria bacterium RIFCSPLOWO2_12_FULL_53_10]
MLSPHFLNRILATLLSIGMMLMSASAIAAPRATKDLPEPYRIPTPNPSNIDAIKDVVGKGSSSRDGEIHQDLSERAVCGGWDMNDTVNGKIPVVSGVPGRKGAPLGNIFSGMAARDESSGALGNGYLYPNVSQVKGWSTACSPGFPPYLDDGPPCKEKNPPYATPAQCQNLCPRINAWQFPVWVRAWIFPLPPPALPLFKYCVQQGKGEKGRNNDPQNGDCCERLGSGDGGPSCAGKYASDADNPKYDPYPGNMPPDAECLIEGAALEAAGWLRVYHAFAGWYYCCTGAIVTELHYSDCTLDDPPACVKHKDARRNCVRCEGDGLPTGQLFPSADTSCFADTDCVPPLICRDSVPAQVFNIPCINIADCVIAGNSGQCIASRCTYPAIPGMCQLVSGASAAIDYNGDLIQRGPAPLRQETGCRAGYDATINGSVMTPGTFVSYYREYPAAGYSRNAVSKAPNDVRSRQGIPVSCYGFYREFDPKNTITTVSDARCVIAAYQVSNEFREFYHSQLGHGSFGETSTYPDPDPTAATEIRDPTFDSAKDLWYQNLGGGFSLLNGEVFKDQGNDMTYALLSLDTTLERARGPLLRVGTAASVSSGHGPDSYDNMRSPGALRRAFDDTVSNARGPARTITEWWQKQETEAQELVHPAVAHIIVPSAWSVGMNLHHYFPSPSLPNPPTSPVPQYAYDPRRMTIDVQTEVRDDLLGEVAAFLEIALIAPVKERSIAIVVPFGSASDFRAYKEGWIRWKKMREDAGATVPTSVQQLTDRLEEYAVQIDGARALRSEIAKVLSTALNRQGKAEKTIHDWLKANLDGFRSFQQQRQQREQLVYRWRSLQTSYRDFHDKTNMPWCKNDAFTTSIYSFLDNWLPGRPNLDGQGLPEFSVPRPEDLYIDLSALQTTQVPLLIPILKPVQILVSHDKLQPPFVYQEDVTIPALPPLPPLPIFSASGAGIPEFSADSGIMVTYPDVSIPSDVPGALTQMEGIISGMNTKYKQFWDAVTKPRCGTLEATKRCKNADPSSGDCCVISGQEKYCRRGWSSDTCVHVEMDLIERFTRIGARPAVQLFEDFFALGTWRTPGNPLVEFPPCDPQDWACLQLHATKVEPRYGWFTEANVRSQESTIDKLRIRMFKETLQMMGSSSSHFPYQTNPNTITPSFDVRRPVEIVPVPATASASSSAASFSSSSGYSVPSSWPASSFSSI